MIKANCASRQLQKRRPPTLWSGRDKRVKEGWRCDKKSEGERSGQQRLPQIFLSSPPEHLLYIIGGCLLSRHCTLEDARLSLSPRSASVQRVQPRVPDPIVTRDKPLWPLSLAHPRPASVHGCSTLVECLRPAKMTEMYSGLHVGQRFSSLEEFKTVIRSISVRQHWELRVVRSNKKSVVIGCRSAANCFFRVVCRSNKNATYITSLQDSHSCRRSADSPNRTPLRSEASHVRFLLNEIPKLFDLNSKIKGQDVVDAVKRYHGYDISMRQAQRALTKLQSQDAGNQGDQSMGLDLSVGEANSPAAQSPPDSQGEAGPSYRDISESRWIADPLPSALIDDETVNPNESPSSHAAAAPAPSAAQSVRRPQILQPPPIGPAATALSHDPRPMAVSHPGVGYPAGAPLPTASTEHPKPPNYQPGGDHHHGVPQMALSNFKIEFTCTTCGSLNQSFFPNQGNVTGGGYISHHALSNQSTVPRHDPSTHSGPDDNASVAEAGGYGVNALNAPVMQSAWAAGGLGVPIGPSNT